ncbi:MICOS complex subunit mic60 [Vermiconidia calcicola]|uniref:MICOS complex subunit mic60 n=1 Tax=Vermiconidia calcicola TaxID=1690605 RepID=A0ACC3NTV6_9PEZI|nr:MICOS complex subunit mic60 [Vermiconidia calcicola]
MLRLAAARSNASLEYALQTGVRRQWQPQRIGGLVRRSFADQNVVAGVPTGPIGSQSGKTTTRPTPTTPATPATSTLPPTGSGTSSTGPASMPPPTPSKKPRRRFRNFLFSLVILSALGYAGAVYYSLVSDNFHDFFTEYIPYGEDAVAYFEERDFRKRFPADKHSSDTGGGYKKWPQTRGEEKVTIGRQSGLTAQVSKEGEDKGSDLGSKGRHVSAVEENKAPDRKLEKVERVKKEDKDAAKGKGDAPPKKEQAAKTDAKTQAPNSTSQPPASKAEAKPAAPEPKPAQPSVPTIDHLSVPSADEAVVQDLIKLINGMITTIDALPGDQKMTSTLNSAKDDVQKIVAGINTLKERASHDAESKVQSAHAEFDNAAKELVKRVEREMQDQEMKWREEYEAEREKLSQSYQQKLATELDSAQKVAEQKTANSLVEQEITLQRKFMDEVKNSVETERQGRLSKLDDLASSVSELENLTSESTSVVDATLRTQHLQVALESVRNKVLESERPTPFLDELVALKEISTNDDLVNAAISSIPPTAYQRGIPTPAHLIDRFRRVAGEVRKASLLPEDAGVASHAASAVLSRFMFTKKADRGLPEGEDVEATLARTEVLLEEGDLDAAAREMNGLKGWAGVLSKDWVGEVRRVLEVRQAVDVIATEARLQSLLVD